MKNRYERNGQSINPEETARLKDKKVCVVGCGGLGGYIIEMLSRVGVGTIVAVDGDVFDETNLNRQILCTEDKIGEKKALVAKERISKVNSGTKLIPVVAFFDESNKDEILEGCDLVFDALDNMSSRRILEAAAEEKNIPLVHGAIAGFTGQVSVVFPGDKTLSKVYEGEENKGIEVETGNPSFTPTLVAAMEVAEGIKVLLDKLGVLRNQILTIDLLGHEYEIIDM